MNVYYEILGTEYTPLQFGDTKGKWYQVVPATTQLTNSIHASNVVCNNVSRVES
jgi:hypothetical protein